MLSFGKAGEQIRQSEPCSVEVIALTCRPDLMSAIMHDRCEQQPAPEAPHHSTLISFRVTAGKREANIKNTSQAPGIRVSAALPAMEEKPAEGGLAVKAAARVDAIQDKP